MCIDVAKVAAIIFMVADHCMMYGGASVEQGLGFFTDSLLGGPLAAPVFMACMGIGVAYSRRNDAASLFRRGWRILAASYILNAVRAAVYLPLGWFGGDAMYYHKFVHLFFVVDILQFAGMALMLLSLLRKLNAGVRTVATVALAMSFAGSLVSEQAGWIVNAVHTDILAIDVPLSLIVGLHGYNIAYPETPFVYSAFPLLNWFVFVAFGLVAGTLLRCCRNTDKLFAVATPPALLLFVGNTIWGMDDSTLIHFYDTEESFYYVSIVDALLVCIPAVVAMLGAGHFAGKALKGKAAALVQRTASDLNRIYLIHWIFVMWVVDALLQRICAIEMSAFTLLLVSFAVVAASASLSRFRPFSRIKL